MCKTKISSSIDTKFKELVYFAALYENPKIIYVKVVMS